MQLVKKIIALLKSTTGKEVKNSKRQLWWIDNKVGGYDGYELQPGGQLFLLNWDLFTGIRWEMTKEGLYTEMVYKRNGNVLKKKSAIVSLSDQQMVLKTVTDDNEFIDTYIKIAYGTVADKYYGHYMNGESYVQVIPLHPYQFQIIFSAHPKADVVKYYGNFDEDKGRLYFRKEDTEITLHHIVNGKVEELVVAGKTYCRPVF